MDNNYMSSTKTFCKFKDENEPYKITPLPNAGDGATKQEVENKKNTLLNTERKVKEKH